MRLVAVGKPNPIRKSAQLEHELMFWERSGNQWNQLGPTKFAGRRFSPTVAEFSDDGNRLLAFDPLAARSQRQVIVLELNTDGKKKHYKWKYSTGGSLNHSVFADPQGSVVLSSVVNAKNTHQVIAWSFEPRPRVIAKSKDIDSEITQIDFWDNAVLGVTKDKKSLYWTADDTEFSGLSLAPRIFRGHRNAIHRANIVQPGAEFVSISVDNPEVLKTNVRKFIKDQIDMSPNIKRADDGSVANTFFENEANDQIIVGNDHGFVAIHDIKAPESPPTHGCLL